MTEKYNDEIDLTELLLKLRNVLLRNSLLIIGFILGGLALGFAYYGLKPSVYQSEVVIRSGILNESLLRVINENLTRVIEEGDTTSLSAKLNISHEIADEVLSINIESAAVDENGTSSFYVITVESLSNEHWQALENGILGYLANNTYVEKRIEANEERYETYIAKLNEEIAQLDSLKMNMGTLERYGNDNFIVMNPSDVYSTLIGLYKQRQEYKENLKFNTAVEIVEDFDAYQQPISPRLLFSMGIGALIGMVMAFLVIGAIEMDHYLKKYEA